MRPEAGPWGPAIKAGALMRSWKQGMTMFRNFVLTTALALVLASPAGADTGAPRDPSVEPPAPQGAPSQTGALTAEAWFDRGNATYALGEAVKLFARTNTDAYVTVLSIGPTGNVTQIFPNEFHPNNLVQAHQPIGIPGEGAQAVVTGALGPETVKIIVTTRPVQLIPEDQLGAAAPFRSVRGGLDAVARDLKMVAAQPELDLVVLDKKFLSVPPAPAPTTRPRRITATPRRRTATPRRRTAPPRRRTATPRRRTATPSRGTATPRRRTATPRRRTATPCRRTATPRPRTATPRQHTATTPRRAFFSPVPADGF